jgi:hypothetical protein
MSLPRVYIGRRRRRAFLLPLALVFLFILLFLEVGLYSLQQRAAQNAFNESSRLAHLIGTEELYSNLGVALDTNAASGPVTVGSNISYQVPNSDLKLEAKWGDKGSLNKGLPSKWATYDGVLKRDPELPEFSFFQTDKDGNVAASELPLGHTRFEVSSSAAGKGTAVVSYSHLFPYGIYAPQGKIIANSISSFTNPVEYTAKDSDQTVQVESGRPVNIFAKSDIEVSDSYSSGFAKSAEGSIKLPKDANAQGAVPLSGHAAGPNPWTSLFSKLTTLGTTVSKDSINKTELFSDQALSWRSLKQLFNGDAAVLESLFGVGQACKVPFFPIPATQSDPPFLEVFFVVHPYPVDFSGVARDKENSEKLKEIKKEKTQKMLDLTEKQNELAEEEAKEKPDKSKIDELKGEISDIQDDIDALDKQASDIAKEMEDDKKNMNIFDAKVPKTAAEDAEQVTTGWAYGWIFNDLWNVMVDILGGHFDRLLDDLVAETRVVHFGDEGPGWEWPGGNIDMRANLTVARGRCLKLVKDEVKVRGDIYLQDGATLYIDGNLTVERPAGWTDFKGVPASDYGGFPKGRLIIEEGASLVVTGNLDINGGDYNNGSVMVTGDYGPNKALTSLIQAGGNINIAHGMSPAATLGDLVDEIAKTDATLKGFNDDFFRPMAEQVFTVLGKLPYAGPWQWRKCWFAEYATTFEFFPWLEEFGLGGPWPIPLPFPNCMTKVFKYFSMAYAVELNATTGENFYTHSPFWPMGRGVTPVLLKVNPDLVADSLKDLKWGKLTLDSIEEEAMKFLKDDMPKFAANIIQGIVITIIEQLVKDNIPFSPPSCGGSSGEGDESEKEKEKIEDIVKEFLKDALKEFGGIVKRSLQKVLLSMKNSVYDNIDSGEDKYSIYRQLPGLVVASGGELTIGKDNPSRMAVGLFIAQRGVNIGCTKTFGTVISLEGDVEVNELHHYPYFDRVSMYNPKKYGDIFEMMVEFGDPKGSVEDDVSVVFPNRIAEGWK